MAKTRDDLEEEFKAILGNDHVYHQPPESIHLSYPCIVYEENPDTDRYSDNKIYRSYPNWSVTLIRTYSNRDKTSELVKDIKDHFEYISHNQHFIADNLIHDVFKLYY